LVGSFHCTFSFPSAVEEGAITASLKDGLLTLQIPKKEELKPAEKASKIPIAEGN
jgi:HSP20 family molecular chaperone IbpA